MQTMYLKFFEIINEAKDLAFPEIEITQKQDKIGRSPWMSQGLLCSQKTKEKLFKLKLKNPTELNKTKFKEYNNLFNI